jgi:hypothetical protein
MKEYAVVMKKMLFAAGTVSLLLSISLTFAVRHAHGQVDDSAAVATDTNFVAPAVFQAAGPSNNSIQGVVTEFQNVFGGKNNGSEGPHDDGRREINWDGGSTAILTTTLSPNPFAGFQGTRGALFTTPDGTGFVQAPPSGLASATVFNNPSYATIFTAFSASRLFSPMGSNVTDVDFFVPGGGAAATTRGFGAVFADVDQPDGSGPGEKRGNRKASTLIEYFGVHGELLFSSFVPASPGDHSLSFFGVVFPDARIAHVRITSGNVVPGADDIGKQDVVMMDDFIYGEPKGIQ